MNSKIKVAICIGIALIVLIGICVSNRLPHSSDSVSLQPPEQERFIEDSALTTADQDTDSDHPQDETLPEPVDESEMILLPILTEPDETFDPPDKEPQAISGRTVTIEDEDRNVIPDRYNCGAKGTLTKVLASDIVNGLQLGESGGINSFDFFNNNTAIAGEIHFNSYDFSDYIVAVYNADQIDRDITLVFENCKFSFFRSLSDHPKVNLVFKSCTFNGFYGSCADFSYCKFGDYYKDGLVPFHDVTVRNCYFSNFSSTDETGAGVHTDGTQIYGKEGLNAENIRYEHCRFEIPHIPGPNAVNACIMLQMEYSNGINISFNDCICNGGGYTIYAFAKYKGFEYYQNVEISNIAVGQSRMFGSLYPTVTDGVVISNIYDTDSLYVASVWKVNGKTHLSVTNDTLQDRLLVVYADGVRYDFTIPATRGGKTDHFDCFEDYPIDIDICLDADCQYVVCFDRTSGMDEQIRFASWDGSNSVSIPWE